MRVSLGRHLGLDRAVVGQALLLAVSAWTAFALASSLHIANAYWAAMPVWVVAQPSRGLLIERGLFRVVGTVLGAAFGFAVLHVVGDRYLQLLTVAGWVALNAALTHVLRGVSAYGALMSGMTAAIVVLPSVLSPEPSLDIALARVECTLIGVVVVTLVTGFFTPTSSRAAFYARTRHMAGDAVDFVVLLLRGVPEPKFRDAERRILVEMSEITAAAGGVAAGSLKSRRRLRYVDALVVASLSVMAAGRALQMRGDADIDGLALIESLSRLAERLRQAKPDRTPDRPAAPAGLADPRLAAALDDLIAADSALLTGVEEAGARAFRREAPRLDPNRDWSVGIKVGIVTGGATALTATAAYAAAWPAGELAALGVCTFSLVLGSMPLPHAIAPHMLKGVTAGILAALIYRFGLQPHVGTLPELLASVAPFLLLGGFARANRKTATAAIDANMCFLLAGQPVLPAVTDPVVILNEAGALMLGAALTTTGFILMPRRPDRQAAKALEAIRRDLERLVASPQAAPSAQWDLGAKRRILRLILHVSRAGKGNFRRPQGLLGVLNLGHAIIGLQRLAVSPSLGDDDRRAIRGVLSALGTFRKELPDADALARQAEDLSDGSAARAVKDAATALRQAGHLLVPVGRSRPSLGRQAFRPQEEARKISTSRLRRWW
ncbi:MAG TPA: FUSC family protein [Alphaproteobacteria bacterium]|nr:FUSC family protein [Alphaproteobacteria bacterium]